jgi:PAS domain S-box-containing protein
MPNEYENAWITSDGRRPVIAWNNSVVRNVAGEIEIIVGIGVDITERRETADRLAMTADNLATAQRLAKIGSWRKIVATEEEEWSDQFYRNLGLEPGSRPSCAETLYERIHPDDRQTVFQAARRSIKEKQPYSVDYRVIQPDGSVHAVHEENGVVSGEDGEVVALIGTMQDVTDLRETENRLQRLTTRLEFAQRTARIGNWEWDAATDRQWWSDEAYRVIGYEPGEVEATDENYFAVIHRDDVALVMEKSLAAEKTASAYEYTCRINLRDGTARVVREIGYPAYDDNGRYIGQNGTIQDITEQYRADRTLADTARRLKDAERIANLGNWEWDPDSDRLTLSDQTYRLIGLEPGSRQLTNDDFLQLVHPKDRQSVVDLMRQTAESGGSHSARYRIVRPDGGVRTITAIAESFEVDGGGQRRLKGTVQDITEQHAARQALSETAGRLKATMRLARLGGWEWDPESNLLKMSDETLRICGLEPEHAEVDNGFLMAMIPEEEHARVLATMHRAISHGEAYTNEYHIVRPNGDKRSVIEHGAASHDGGSGRVKLTGTIQDITERKLAEQNIALNLRRLALSQEAALIGSSEWDLETGEVWWSDQQYRNYGAEPGGLELSIKSFIQYLHPADRDAVEAGIDRIMTDGTIFDQEYRVIGKDGIQRVLWSHCIAERDENGRPVRLIATTLDITGRKVADENLRETATNLAHSQRIAHLGSWVWNFLDDSVWWSDEVYRIFGLEIGSITLTANAFLEYVHPDDHELLREVEKKALGEGAPYVLEYRLLRPDGAERVVSENAEIEYDANGDPLRMRGTVQDITERKQAELVLRQTMERLREAQIIGRMGSWTWDPVTLSTPMTATGPRNLNARQSWTNSRFPTNTA